MVKAHYSGIFGALKNVMFIEIHKVNLATYFSHQSKIKIRF
jgi:hypothetical protein